MTKPKVLKQYYEYLDRLFKVGGLLEQISKLRRHWANLTTGCEKFRWSLLGMSSNKYFQKYYLGGRDKTECSQERIEEELLRMADNAGCGTYDGLLYAQCLSAIYMTDSCAKKLNLKMLRKPYTRTYWVNQGEKKCPIKEYEDFINKYTYCEEKMNCLGKLQLCYVDSYNRNTMRRRLEVMQKYGLRYSIGELESLDRRELEKDKRRVQRKLKKEA